MWARDGSRLFYRDGRHLVAATLSTTAGLAVTGRKELFADTYMFAGAAAIANYDVSPDGTRFLMVKSAERPEALVAYGWLNELRARSAARRIIEWSDAVTFLSRMRSPTATASSASSVRAGWRRFTSRQDLQARARGR